MKDKPLDELSERLVIKVNNSSLSLMRYQLKGPSQPHLFLIVMLTLFNLAMLCQFYSEPVETKKYHCETTQE